MTTGIPLLDASSIKLQAKIGNCGFKIKLIYKYSKAYPEQIEDVKNWHNSAYKSELKKRNNNIFFIRIDRYRSLAHNSKIKKCFGCWKSKFERKHQSGHSWFAARPDLEG